MDKLTYHEAYSKIIDAYFKDEIRPMEMNFCFCGTLAGGMIEVNFEEKWDEKFYSMKEFIMMERALMKGLGAQWISSLNSGWDRFSHNPHRPDYEDRLFQGMSAALDVLKEIHSSRGENVDDVPEFTKRLLPA
jgi:hypothetical protein